METIEKKVINRNMYVGHCSKCNKEIIGTSSSQVEFNIKIHQLSKSCEIIALGE